MYLKIKRIDKLKTRWGDDLVIKMIALHDDSGKFIKNVKLNNELISILKNSKINLT